MPKSYGRGATSFAIALLMITSTTFDSWAQIKGASPITGNVPGIGAVVGGPTPSQGQNQAATSVAPGDADTSGQVGAVKSIRLKDTWSLDLNVGVDTRQQTQSSPAGDVKGRVGLGLKF